MAEKRYFWLKLFDDFFTSKRIKRLRSLAGGDTYTIIYLKMQLKALKSDGFLYFDGVMNDFAEELALDLDEKPDDVRLTIQYLLSVGLLETNNDDAYKLTYMEKVIGSESASTQRSRDCRLRKKEQKLLQCNANTTQVQQVGNAEIDIEVDKEIDIEIEKEIEKDKEVDIEVEKEIDHINHTSFPIDYHRIVDMFNDICKSYLPFGYEFLSASQKVTIRTCMELYTYDDFKTMFQKAEASDFLKGANHRDWTANFGWMIRPENMKKILSGQYDNKEDS